MAKFILSAGHTLHGGGTGAIGLLHEAEEARKVVNAVKRYLTGKGHTVIIDNVDTAHTQNEYLRNVVQTANAHADADLFVSIHFNASSGTARGTEVYTYKGQRLSSAVGICAELSKYGFRNRGVKDGSDLYVIRKTTMPAVLVEVCFVDDELDARLYKALGVNIIGQAITRGILKG